MVFDLDILKKNFFKFNINDKNRLYIENNNNNFLLNLYNLDTFKSEKYQSKGLFNAKYSNYIHYFFYFDSDNKFYISF